MAATGVARFVICATVTGAMVPGSTAADLEGLTAPAAQGRVRSALTRSSFATMSTAAIAAALKL